MWCDCAVGCLWSVVCIFHQKMLSYLIFSFSIERSSFNTIQYIRPDCSRPTHCWKSYGSHLRPRYLPTYINYFALFQTLLNSYLSSRKGIWILYLKPCINVSVFTNNPFECQVKANRLDQIRIDEKTVTEFFSTTVSKCFRYKWPIFKHSLSVKPTYKCRWYYRNLWS